MNAPPRDTHAKALAINLDATAYGSFAEIGAGQEVARWFLSVGAASGTVAQAISAYDKTFSDETYGAGTRYVSRERLLAMLDREFDLLVRRLAAGQPGTRFFAFADTAAARNFRGDNDQHAWVGVRFQHAPGADPSDLVVHLALRDPTAALQQEALGVFGVNLIHATLYSDPDPDVILPAVGEGLAAGRLEADVVEVRGPRFRTADSRAWNLGLVRRRLGRAVVFAGGRAVDPSAVLRKRPVLMACDDPDADPARADRMLAAADRLFRAEVPAPDRDPARLRDAGGLGGPGGPGGLGPLARLDAAPADVPVLFHDFGEPHELADHLRRYTAEAVRFVLPVSQVARLLEGRFYHRHPGRLLRELGELLDDRVRVYAYPVPREEVLAEVGEHAAHMAFGPGTGGLLTADDIRPHPPVDHLYRYIREAGWLVPVDPE